MLTRPLIAALLISFLPWKAQGQDSPTYSVAREWNEALLQSIREDFARPTVHARNIFHSSSAMWDAWSAYEPTAEPYMLGNEHNGFFCSFDGVPDPGDIVAAREKAISYASYRLLRHRFTLSPGMESAMARYDILMNELGYDRTFTSTDYSSGDPAALGNYIAQCFIEYGMQDGANEAELYSNRHYRPVNPPMAPPLPGNPLILDLNRWQPLSFDIFIDQSGQEIPLGVPEFLGPEWGSVYPFSLTADDLTIHRRNGFEYWVYHDPGPPPYVDPLSGAGLTELYQWNFSLVSVWSSHLDPNDGVMWDISPASQGNFNIEDMPTRFEDFSKAYDLIEGGDPGQGWRLNPSTGQPYWAQIVPRGDYARVLAEFWADGPDSETPPGHWFTILNYVSDHPMLVKRYKGEGPVLDDLEWDVKSYFALGGAMHDSAISAWGIKGWYDYIRPISAIRGMAELGQSSDPSLPRYHPAGLPLIPGKIELVAEDDPLVGANNEHLDKLKVLSWRGPEYVFDPEVDEGGVGWILVDDWWPYQRPTFVTPPFAAYVSGHSTFSRAAAEVMTMFTGDEFFPGGMGEFYAPKNEFLVFEGGPSEDVTLQWATYRDASDQTSLSRIWGGIHPPADDIFGRFIGREVGIEAFNFAERFFSGTATTINEPVLPAQASLLEAYPNPIRAGLHITLNAPTAGSITLFDMMGRTIRQIDIQAGRNVVSTDGLAAGVYFIRHDDMPETPSASLIVIR